jgi:serine/threonine protein kinase
MPSKEELLKVAHDVACGVRDAHNFDHRERATIAHCDLSPDQFLLVDGVYKLNDFNRAKFLSWDPERDEQCGFTFELNQGNVSANVLRPNGPRALLLNRAMHYQTRLSHFFFAI